METTRNWNWPQFVLALIALGGLIVMTLYEQWGGKVADAGTRQIMIGFATLAFAFFFQSSAGSKAKDDTISAQATSLAVVTPALAGPPYAEMPSATPTIAIAPVPPHVDAASHL